MVSLGYGRWVKADRIFALVPVEGEQRGDGRRTYVHVEGVANPIVASRSERAILAEIAGSGGSSSRGPHPPQDPLF